jgi:iron complex transport system permease protein
MTLAEIPRPIAPAGELTGRSILRTVGVLAGVLVVVAALCASIGQQGWMWPWASPARLARVAAAMTVGAALAVAGATLQSLLRNGLADPYVLGVSGGAGVGVLAGIVIFGGATWAGRTGAAAIGAGATMGIVYLIAQRRGRLDAYSLLLSGVIINTLAAAIMATLYLFAQPGELKLYINWSLGSIPDAPAGDLLGVCAAATGAGWLWLAARGQAFNVQSLGDDVATSSGIHLTSLRLQTFCLAGVLTAAAVALAGPVGFVGLIVPHVCRMILGADHRRLILAAGFIGAIFLVAADTFCRSTVLQFGQELPVGVVTSFVGAPFFLFLLRRRLREGYL